MLFLFLQKLIGTFKASVNFVGLCFIRLKYKILSATRISHLTEELIKFCSKEKFNLFYNLYHSQHF